jgi:membrane peptidoglycan carboxypeptidase
MRNQRSSSRLGTTSRAAGFVGASALAGVLVAGLLLPLAGGIGIAAQRTTESFDSLPSELTTPPLAQQSRILDRKGGVIATIYDQNRIYVPLSKVAPIMRTAIISIEDSRFYSHGGVDVRGTLRAAVQNSGGDSVQGGSTITQQVVKNELIEQALSNPDPERSKVLVAAARERSLGRKIQEARYAVALEKRLTKDQILERYLNVSYFGQGTYGVEAAARRYFAVNASQLTAPQAAFLAGVVQNPSAYDPKTRPKAAIARRNVVLDRMAQLGGITVAKARALRKSGLGLKTTASLNGCITATAPYFCDYVVNVLENDEAFGATKEARKALLRRGGLTIKTTLDPSIQRAAQKAVVDRVPVGNRDNVAAAISMVQPGTGDIVAMAQNTRYDPKVGKGNTTVNYSTDLRTGGATGFQMGSTFKIFTLAAGLRRGVPINEPISAPARRSWSSGFTDCSGGDATEPGYSAENFDKKSYTADMYRGAQRSVNTYFLELERRAGLCETTEIARRFGIVPADPGSKPTDLEVQTFTLGVSTVAPLALTGAYAGFASHGVYCAPTAITSVIDQKKKSLRVPGAACKQAIERPYADAVTDILRTVVTSGTGQPAAFPGRQLAGKTGTTENHRDVAFAGYSRQYASVVWVGREKDRTSLNRLTINGQPIDASGSRTAGPIWREAMQAAHQGLPALNFSPVDYTVIKRSQVSGKVPDVRGMTPSQAAAALTKAGLSYTIDPAKVTSPIASGKVAGTSPGAGSPAVAGSGVVLFISSGPAVQQSGGGAQQIAPQTPQIQRLCQLYPSLPGCAKP